MLYEIVKFNKNVEMDIQKFSNLTIDQYLKRRIIVTILHIIIFIQWREVYGLQS